MAFIIAAVGKRAFLVLRLLIANLHAFDTEPTRKTVNSMNAGREDSKAERNTKNQVENTAIRHFYGKLNNIRLDN